MASFVADAINERCWDQYHRLQCNPEQDGVAVILKKMFLPTGEGTYVHDPVRRHAHTV